LFRLTDLGRQTAKGFAEPVEAFAVEGVAVTESRFEAARRGLTDLVGRASESALLRERLREAWAGAGQIVLLSGEAGIGKSTSQARSVAPVVMPFDAAKALTTQPPILARRTCIATQWQ